MEKYKVTKLPLNLQFFADENPDDNSTDKPTDEPVTLTQEELDKKIESESDKRLAKVLAKKQAEWEASLDEKVEAKLKEDKRLSKLSEADRKEEQLSQKEKDLARREAEIARTQVKADVINALSERKLPTQLAEFITLDDNEQALEQIKTLNTVIDDIKREAVKEATRQSVPGSGATVFANNTDTSQKSIEEIANAARKIK